MEKNCGGMAFPLSGTEYDEHNTPIDTFVETGMFLRDYFAAKAMQGAIAGMTARGETLFYSQCAALAYEMADAMLEARDK